MSGNYYIAMLENFLTTDTLIWVGILLCLSQSALFSGLNIAVFSIPRLSLEIEAGRGHRAAVKLLRLRENSNYLLATILWGNVGINVLLTLLSDSVLAGVSAFCFSTIVITFVGEITPQAYFSRHAMKMASLLSPFLKFYQFLLYPVVKPVAMLLDAWLGKEGVHYYRERDLREVIRKHTEAEEAEDVEQVEGMGAMNFLAIDDMLVSSEGEPSDPESIIELPVQLDLPVFPEFKPEPNDPLMQRLNCSEHKWVILTGPEKEPLLVMDVDGFLRAALFSNEKTVNPYHFCHRPLVVRNPNLPLGDVIWKLKYSTRTPGDEVIDNDIILVWTEQHKRVITGADLLGRLLKGIGHEAYSGKPESQEAKEASSQNESDQPAAPDGGR